MPGKAPSKKNSYVDTHKPCHHVQSYSPAVGRDTLLYRLKILPDRMDLQPSFHSSLHDEHEKTTPKKRKRWGIGKILFFYSINTFIYPNKNREFSSAT